MAEYQGAEDYVGDARSVCEERKQVRFFAEQAKDHVTAVELADGDHIQAGDQQADPGGH